MTTKRKRNHYTQPVGCRVKPDTYEKVGAACKNMRLSTGVCTIGDFTEAAYRVLLSFSPMFRREFLESLGDEGFWRVLAEGVHSIEPRLLPLLTRKPDGT